MALAEPAWEPAIEADGSGREGAWVTELTDHLDFSSLAAGHPADHPPRASPPRRPVRGLRRPRIPPHRLHHRSGGSPRSGALELRHRHRARCEDAIRAAKDTGIRKPALRRLREQPGLAGALAPSPGSSSRGLGSLCLEGELALAEPKRVRQRLLHVAGRVVRSGPTGDLAVAGHLALGRGSGGGVCAAAGAAGRFEPVAAALAPQPRFPSTQSLISPCPRTGRNAPIRRRLPTKRVPRWSPGTASRRHLPQVSR